MPVYDASERSTFLGRDVRLYSFTRGGTTYYNNSGDRDLLFGGNTYVATAIEDAGFKQKGEAVQDDFVITTLLTHPIAAAFLGVPPTDLIKVMVRQIQYGDTEAPLIWSGYVSSVRLKDDSIGADIVCNTQVAYLARRGLRLSYMRQCNHALYDEGCKVNRDAYRETATVRVLTGDSFNFDIVQAGPIVYEGRFTAGYVEWQSPNGNYFERRAIESHRGDYCMLLSSSSGMTVGMTVKLYPGCQLVPANCKLFNNIPNYGGFIMLPGKSPFDGNPVF